MKTISTFARTLGCATISLCALQTASAQYSETFDSCVENAEGITLSTLECIYAEHAQQDQLLNASYKALISNLDAESQTMLKTAQRSWITLRDNNCQLHGEMAGGQMSTLFLEDCHLQMTADRASELAWMVEMTSN